ncbi:MAG: hypothetical protein ACTHMK_11790 [Dyella sp.]|uniref:hypothetical protein n=1 Tax=Dyella sp. TaxID=1869338 RepID=UPI003F7EA40F
MHARSWIRPLCVVALVTALLLCIPLVAMHFTNEVRWTAGDFVVGAALLLSAGTAIVVGRRLTTSAWSRRLVVAGVLLVLLLVWAQLAVGLFS